LRQRFARGSACGHVSDEGLAAYAGQFAPDVSPYWQKGRIPPSPQYPDVAFRRWFSSDSRENYLARGNRDFSEESIGYEFNSLGYRGPELERADGEAAVLFLGDSFTAGIGLPWEGVWTTLLVERLALLWGKPVRQFNLAWPATSCDYPPMMVHQTVELLNPQAVFVLWTLRARITWFPDATRFVRLMPHYYFDNELHRKSHEAYLRLATPSNAFFNFVRNVLMVSERLARLDIPFYWGTVEPMSVDLLRAYLPIDGFIGTLQPCDAARDNEHPGLRTHAHFADLAATAAARGRRP